MERSEYVLPSVRFNFIFDTFLQTVLRICGVNVLSPTYRPGLKTIRYISLIVLGTVCQLYTIICLDLERRLICLSTVFITPQAVLKFFTYTQKSRFFSKQLEVLRAFYRQCEAVTGYDKHGHCQFKPELAILDRWMAYFRLLLLLFGAILLILIAFCLGYPSIVYITQRRIDAILPIYLPAVRFDTTGGILANWLSQLMLLGATVFGLAGTDIVMALFNMHCCLMCEVLCTKLDTMASTMRRRRLTMDFAHARTDGAYLRQCIQLHQALCAYVAGLADVYYPIYSMDIMSNFISMCVVLFLQMQVSYFPLYSYMVLFFVKTFVLCAMGTIVDIYVSNSRIFVLTIM